MTNSATYTFANLDDSVLVGGWVAFADSTTGLEDIVFTDRAAAPTVVTSPTVEAYNADVELSGGGNTIYLIHSAGSPLTNNAASISDTDDKWDVVDGWALTLSFDDAQASVFGGGNAIDFFGTADAASLYNTGPAWDTVSNLSGSIGTIYFTDACASVFGGGQSINLLGTSGNSLSIYSTSGDWDCVSGSDATIYLTDAQASVMGGANLITLLGSVGNQVSLYDTSDAWDVISDPRGGIDTIYLTDAQASVFGGDQTVDLLGPSGNAVSLYDTTNDWDRISGSGATIYLTDAQTSLFGGLDTVNFAGGSSNAVSLYNTNSDWDTVVGSSGSIYLTSSQTYVIGNDDTIDFAGGSGNFVSISEQADAKDTINGSAGAIDIYGAIDSQTYINGSDDEIGVFDSSTVVLHGADARLMFGQGIGGLDLIDDFNTTDTVEFSKSDFANYHILLDHMTQSGANGVVTFNATDTVTLSNVTVSGLVSSQFLFV